jgi:hypothetical protein
VTGPGVNMYHRLFRWYGRSFEHYPIGDAPSRGATAYDMESFDESDDQRPLL